MSPQEQVFRRGFRWSVIAIIIATVAGCAISYAAWGMPGLWSALGGAAASAVFGLGTQAAAILTVRKQPLIFAGILAASSMGKILLIIIATAVAQSFESLVRPAFGMTLLAGALAAIIIDVVVFVRGRIPYVSPGASTPDDGVR